MKVLNYLKRLWNQPHKGHRRRKRVDSVTALVEDYQDLRRLARQVRAHAEIAPYAYVNQRMNQIALEKEDSASRLKEKILYLRGQVIEDPVNDFYRGKNHWSRLLQDIEDQKELEDRLAEDVIFVDQESHEIGDLLREIAAEAAVHQGAFKDLLAKADPQAYLS